MGSKAPQSVAEPSSGVVVHVPAALRTYTQGRPEVVLEAHDVATLLELLERDFPGIRDRVVDETGRPRRYVNIFVNGDLLQVSPSEVRLRRGDMVHILPNIAGG